jgi:hypothetical protein
VNHLKGAVLLIDGEVGVRCAVRAGWSSRLSAVAETSPPLLCTFDLLELNGTDPRREPIAVRKATRAIRSSGPIQEYARRILPLRMADSEFDRVWYGHCPDEAPKPVAS